MPSMLTWPGGRVGLPRATLDKRLRAAAAKAGVALLKCVAWPRESWLREEEKAKNRKLKKFPAKRRFDSFHRAEDNWQKYLWRGLDGIRKAGIVTNGPGVLGIVGSD